MTREEAIDALRELLTGSGYDAGAVQILALEYADDIAKNFADAGALRRDFAGVERMVERIALAMIALENAGGTIH